MKDRLFSVDELSKCLSAPGYRSSMEENLFTVDELGAVLKVPRSWIYQRTMRNGIPGQIKLGKHLRFKATAIRMWIEEGCPKPSESFQRDLKEQRQSRERGLSRD